MRKNKEIKKRVEVWTGGEVDCVFQRNISELFLVTNYYVSSFCQETRQKQ